jgi:hypothetical protein
MVGAALEHAAPAAVEGMDIRLGLTESDVHLEGLERNRAEVEAGRRAVFGADLRVRYVPATGEEEGGSRARGAPAQRLDQQTDRGERLRAYRKKDQALDVLADAMDLELLD